MEYFVILQDMYFVIADSTYQRRGWLVLLQVFHSLLKAHAVEARAVVRQALEILTPAMPGRMEDGNVRHTFQS